MIKNIGISGTPEEIQIIAKLLELEGYKSIYDNINIRSLLTYTDKKFGVYYNEITYLDKDVNTKVFKASEFDQAYKYLFDTELFSTEYFTNKKVVIHCSNEEEWKSINTLFEIKWFNSTVGWQMYKESICINIDSTQYGNTDFYTQRNYTIIPASFVLKFKKENNIKEIIGYKCPVNMFNGELKKDDILVKNDSYYKTQGSYRLKNYDSNSYYILPKEIVETWTPVYKSKEVTLRLGNPLQNIVINEKGITCNGDTMKFAHLKNISEDIDDFSGQGTWSINISEIKIGCSKFSTEEFNQVLNVSKEFYNF